MDRVLEGRRDSMAQLLSVPQSVPRKLRLYVYTEHRYQGTDVPEGGAVMGGA